MILTANFPYQQPYTIPGDRRAPLRRGYNRYRNNPSSSEAPRILCRITLPKLQQQPDNLMQFAIVLSIIGALFVGFQKFASLEAGLDPVKNSVRKIDKLDDKIDNQNNKIDNQNRELNSKIDRFLTDINQERVDIADLGKNSHKK
jgi:hypothetical protein